jgi:hypothetical protein
MTNSARLKKAREDAAFWRIKSINIRDERVAHLCYDKACELHAEKLEAKEIK